jgi:hypothetical protein
MTRPSANGDTLVDRLIYALSVSYGQRTIIVTKLTESHLNSRHDLLMIYPSGRKYWYSWRNWI